MRARGTSRSRECRRFVEGQQLAVDVAVVAGVVVAAESPVATASFEASLISIVQHCS